MARRLGAFFLTLALLLYAYYRQSTVGGLPWRAELMPYMILFGILGAYLMFRSRQRAEKSSRFGGVKRMLFETPEKKKAAMEKKKKGNKEQG